MNYKGYKIVPHYGICLKSDGFEGYVDRKPTSKDIEWYDVLDPMDNDKRAFAETDIKTCKAEIDRILGVIGMPDNKKATWEALPCGNPY